MTRRTNKISGKEIISSGSLIAEGDEKLELYLIDSIDIVFEFSVEIKDGEDETEVTVPSDEVIRIKNTRPWRMGASSGSINELSLGSDEDGEYYFSYAVNLLGRPSKFVYTIIYTVTRVAR